MNSDKPTRIKSIFIGWAACFLLAVALLHAAATPRQAAPVVINVRMNAPQAAMPNGRLGRPAESIAADPSGKLLVAGWETMQGTCGKPFGAACTPPAVPGVTAYGYSTDGGRTWTDGGPVYLPGDIMTSGHPWLDRGGVDNQTFFMITRARTVAETAKDHTPGGSGQVGLVLYRGRFSNGRFAWLDQRPFSPANPKDLLRSPSLLAAKDGSGRLFLTMSNLRGVCNRPGSSSGQIEMLRSADEGKTWEGPVVISPDDTLDTVDPKDPRCGSDGTYQVQSTAALGTKGELYVTWQFGPRVTNPYFPVKTTRTTSIHFARSLDGGKTFSKPQSLTRINSMREDPPVGYSKFVINDGPRLAVGKTGRLFVVFANAASEIASPYTEQAVVPTQVYVVTSDDQGATWSQPRALAPAGETTVAKRFWPTIAVRDNGAVDVVFFESQERHLDTAHPDAAECIQPLTAGGPRKGKVSSLVDLYWVQSTDGGASFSNPFRITSETSNWCKAAFDKEGTQFGNFGDFLGIATAANRSFAVWPDGRAGVPDAYFAVLPATAPQDAASAGTVPARQR